MHSGRGFTHGEAPPPSTRSLALTLKPGWWYDADAAAFVSPSGERMPVADRLPPGSRLVVSAPALAKTSPAPRAAPEREHARPVGLLLAAEAAPQACKRRARGGAGGDKAAWAPQGSQP
jgi:hypothetical protein